MALPTSIRKSIESKFKNYCSKKVPPEFRDRMGVEFKISGNSVTLFEKRPMFNDPSEWTEIVVAQFRYNLYIQEWSLYCADLGARWFEYSHLGPDKDFDVLLREVEKDPAGMFWG